MMKATDQGQPSTDQIESYRSELSEATEALRAELRGALDASSNKIQSIAEQLEKIRQSLFIPTYGISPPIDGPYMAYSTCSSADMRHRRFVEACDAAGLPKIFGRKVWEWAFVIHHLQRLNAIGPGKRGLVFGVGTEPLPSFFANHGAHIVATDAPPEIGKEQGWLASNQFAASLESLWREDLIDREAFMQRVSYEPCDMTNIPAHLTDFDFCWSSCCFEHLGSLEAGIDFVVNSVERTLKPGGIAVHTTEFNLSSDTETVSSGPTVIYRKRDMEGLIHKLRERGHEVDDLKIAPEVDPLDFHVDMPPYSFNPHLKLHLMGYTATSVGLVIRRGGAG